MMELCLHCDITVWRRIWSGVKGGAGFYNALTVCCCFCCSHQMIAMHFATISVCYTNLFLFSMHHLEFVQSVLMWGFIFIPLELERMCGTD